MPDIKVFITGTSSGFGFLTAKTLIEKGYTVFAGMRDPFGRNKNKVDLLSHIAQESGGKVHCLENDITSDDSVDESVKKAIELEGNIDVLINNAGVGCGGWWEGFTSEQLQNLMDVNLLGVHRMNRAVVPYMRQKKKGLIIYVSSLMGRIIIPFAGPYVATKFALEGLAESYHYELKNFGIDSSIVEPGGFGTNFGQSMEQPKDKERLKDYGVLIDEPDKMWNGVIQMLEGENAPDIQDVPDAIVSLIEAEDGKRPFRTVVDPLMGGSGVEKLNRLTDEIQAEVMKNMGMA